MSNYKSNLIRRIVVYFTILLFFHNGVLAQTPQEENDIKNVGIETEKLRQLFLQLHSFKKLYLVFAGPYPSSPTSSFGHIFALIEPQEKKPFLLWDAIDFSADISEVGSFNFFLNGIFGSLDGQYKIIPFYEKLREYTFIESRSLWLFPIQFDKQESQNLLNNLFQVQGKVLPYKFANHNCASEILRLINNSKKNPNDISNVLVLPRDVIRKTHIDSVIFIESISASLTQYNMDTLIIDNKNDSLTLSSEISLQKKLSFLEWQNFHGRTSLTEQEKDELNRLRKEVSRSEKNDIASLRTYAKKFSIHPTMRADVACRYSSELEPMYLLKYRFGLHEYFDPSIVYPKDDYLSIFNIELGYTDKKIFLNKFMLFEQTSLQPISFLSNSSSWKMGFGIDQQKELGKRKLAAGLFLASGYTFPILGDNFSISLLISTDPVFLGNNDYSLLLGSEIILRWRITENIKFMSAFRETAKNISEIKLYYSLDNMLGVNITNNLAILFSSSISMYNQDFTFNFHYYLN